jgi:uncharacterized membrane protein
MEELVHFLMALLLLAQQVGSMVMGIHLQQYQRVE